MAITIKARSQLIPVDPNVAKVGYPVTAEVTQAIINTENTIWEGLWDTAVNGNLTKTVEGHDHTGAGQGKPIPKHLASVVFGTPEMLSGSASPTAYQNTGFSKTLVYDEGGADTTVNANLYRYISGAKTTGVDYILAQVPVRLNKGVKGVEPRVEMGISWTTGTYAINWYLLTDNYATTLDEATETIGGSVNVGMRTCPNASASGGPWLAANSGSALASEKNAVFVLTAKWSATPGASDTPYIYSVSLYEKT